MSKLNDIQKIYFIGIGGIGMSALARYFKAKGVDVSGYDKKTALAAAPQSGGGRFGRTHTTEFPT